MNLKEGENYDNQAESLFKKPGHDDGSDLPGRKVEHDARPDRSDLGGAYARELIKISVLNNCADDPRELAEIIAERTRSQVVQVIGKKIVLYREGKDDRKKIMLPALRAEWSLQ